MGEIRSRRWKAPRWSQGLQGPPRQGSRQRRRAGDAGPGPRVGPKPWSRVPPREQDGAGCASRKGPMEAVALSNAARFRMGNNPRGASAAPSPRGAALVRSALRRRRRGAGGEEGTRTAGQSPPAASSPAAPPCGHRTQLRRVGNKAGDGGGADKARELGSGPRAGLGGEIFARTK